MSPAVIDLMESLILDPARYREFSMNPDVLLAGSGLSGDESRAIVGGEVSTINRMLGDKNSNYIEGAVVIITVVDEED